MLIAASLAVLASVLLYVVLGAVCLVETVGEY